MSDRLYVGRCGLDLQVENCQSLKDKRRIVVSLKEKLKNRFNIAVCEFGDLSLWQRAQLGVVTCGNSRQHVDSSLRAAVDYVEGFRGVNVLNYDIAVT